MPFNILLVQYLELSVQILQFTFARCFETFRILETRSSSLVLSSVTRLGDFLKFLAAKCLAKEAQMMCNFLGNFEKLNSLATFWVTLGKFWATFYSNIWSHWTLFVPQFVWVWSEQLKPNFAFLSLVPHFWPCKRHKPDSSRGTYIHARTHSPLMYHTRLNGTPTYLPTPVQIFTHRSIRNTLYLLVHCLSSCAHLPFLFLCTYLHSFYPSCLRLNVYFKILTFFFLRNSKLPFW